MFALKINTKVNYQEFKCTILMKPNITSQHGDFHDLWINLYPQMSEYLLSLESVKRGSKYIYKKYNLSYENYFSKQVL